MDYLKNQMENTNIFNASHQLQLRLGIGTRYIYFFKATTLALLIHLITEVFAGVRSALFQL